MTKSWWMMLGVWVLGCLAATSLVPSLRAIFSPWRAIEQEQIVMFSSDSCMVSRRAVALIQADPRLADFIVPVPAGGPGKPAVAICEASLQILHKHRPWIRWMPETLACSWLAEDAFAVVPEDGVPTPSWYSEGKFVGSAGSAEEAALFRSHGWRIEWTHAGLQLSPLDEVVATVEVPSAIRRIEDLGMSSFRDERW